MYARFRNFNSHTLNLFNLEYKATVLITVEDVRRGPLGPVLKILYRSWSVQDLKNTKRTSKDLIHDVFKVEAKIKALFWLVCASCK